MILITYTLALNNYYDIFYVIVFPYNHLLQDIF
jgi:hypothetical protein